jgi:hypothetical protein
MLFRFNHPKPVGDGKAVAVLVVARKTEAPSTMHTLIAPDVAAAPDALAPLPVGGTPAVTAPIRFSVSYGLREYLSFVREHATHLIKRRRRAAAVKRRTSLNVFEKPMLLKAMVGALATPVFLLKRRRAACSLEIDDVSITRVSSTGRTTWPWSAVREVRQYSRGYLLFFPTGAIPVPFRCLDRRQLTEMEALVRCYREA